MKEIADHLGVHYLTVRRAVKRVEAGMHHCKTPKSADIPAKPPPGKVSHRQQPAGRSKKKASEEVNKRQLYLFDCESIRDKA